MGPTREGRNLKDEETVQGRMAKDYPDDWRDTEERCPYEGQNEDLDRQQLQEPSLVQFTE